MDSSGTKYADVILPLPLEGFFTYLVPREMENDIVVGGRVVVQFGAKRFYSALVHSIHYQCPEGYEIKNIESLLDREAVVPTACFALWDWIAGYYHCSIGEVYKAALPSGLKLESETSISLNVDFVEDVNDKLSSKEEEVFQVIYGRRNLTIHELNSPLKKKNTLPVLNELLRKGAVVVEEELKETVRPKTETHIVLSPEFHDELKINRMLDLLTKVPKQQRLLGFILQKAGDLALLSKFSMAKKELLTESGCSVAILNGLIGKSILKTKEVVITRLDESVTTVKPMYPLSEVQQLAYRQIKKSFDKNVTTLLHGVTGSGKTEIYIQLIADCIAQGKQVLYLLPEIGLTTQIISRLKRVFGNKTGVYHSKFNDAERVEIWNKVLRYQPESDKNYQLIVGARSALFLPFSHLGLIIVDEEHENSFKQYDPAPRYHARDSAIVLGHLHQIPVLLGTATPSVETYFNAQQGKYGFVELTGRHGRIELPEIQIADLKEAYRKKEIVAHLTPLLHDEIELALKNNEQVILFQNRRGFSPFVECKACGWVPKCNHCDVSLTYHKHNHTLACHYCGWSMSHPGSCRSCGSKEVNTKGFGTEKIEEELSELFPSANVERMDLDTTRTKNGFDNLIKRFEMGSIDILVGTQMITKGLDFEHVSVVGILNADNLLNFPDFRSHERSYQLMAQVGGRAGRKHKQGRVIIQTSDPSHPVIKQVIDNDYQAMYKSQIEEREQFKYPPFYRLINVTLKHRDKGELERITNLAARALRREFGQRVLGPEDPAVNRIKLMYIKQMWMKFERDISISSAKRRMQQILDSVKSQEGNKMVQIIVDVDPM